VKWEPNIPLATEMTAIDLLTTQHHPTDIQVRYLRPLKRETGRVVCTGMAVHVGGKVATAEGRIVDEAGKLYATGTTSCLLFDVPEAKSEVTATV